MGSVLIPTTQVISDRAHKADDLPWTFEMCNLEFATESAKNFFSKRAGQILHDFTKNAGVRIVDDVVHTIPISLMTRISHLSAEDFIKEAEDLMDVKIRIISSSTRSRSEEILLARIIDVIEKTTDPETNLGIIKYKFSDTYRDIVANSMLWTVLSRSVLYKLSSRYSFRVYELISMRQSLRQSEDVFTIPEFRRHIGVADDTLKTWDELRRRAVIPSVEDITEHTRFNLTYEPIKKGRGVGAIKLMWSLKKSVSVEGIKLDIIDHPHAPAGEVKLLGDKTRNQISFPTDGSIYYSIWSEVAKENLPYPTPDLDLVASSFRKFCEKSQISLSAKNISNVFSGFCRSFKSNY